MNKFHIVMALAVSSVSWPALSNSLVSAGTQTNIARSSLSATPAGEWNKLSYRGGKNVEVWTIDGDTLNKVTFYGGIQVGKPLFKEADKKAGRFPGSRQTCSSPTSRHFLVELSKPVQRRSDEHR